MKQERIGPKIKRFRKSQNLTQKELAEALGYSDKSMITHIEKGDSDMTYEKILIFLRKFALDANELFEVEKIDKLIEQNESERRKRKKVFIYIHGLHGSHEEIKDFTYLSDEYEIKGLEYQDGNPWELKEELQKKFEELSKDYKEVNVIANSIGAFYTYEYLSEFNINKAFFISPIADMFQIMFNIMMDNKISDHTLEEKKFITLSDGTVLSDDFYKSQMNHEDNWKTPTEILYGDRDELVYIESIASFLSDHPNAKLTIKKDAEHYFHTDSDKQFIKDWILKSL